MNYDTSIFALGNSHAIRLPKILLDALNFNLDEKVVISMNDDSDTIIIKKASPKVYKSIKDRFVGYTGEYVPVEWDTGKAVGMELF